MARVQAAMAEGRRYDVVLMDWRMPDLDGRPVLQTALHGEQGASANPPLVFGGAQSAVGGARLLVVEDNALNRRGRR